MVTTSRDALGVEHTHVLAIITQALDICDIATRSGSFSSLVVSGGQQVTRLRSAYGGAAIAKLYLHFHHSTWSG